VVPANHPIDPTRVQLTAPAPRGCEGAVGEPGLSFVGELTRRFGPRLEALLAARRWDQASWDEGQRPGFLEETAELRRADWRAAPLPEELHDRRIEVLGPPERGPLVRGLSSGARLFVADLEDGLSPTWANVTRAQQNLLDAVTGSITCEQQGVEVGISGHPAGLAIRPRGLHLVEGHVLVDGQPAPAALFDAGLFLSNSARALAATRAHAFLSLPKLEHYLEARLWDDVLRHVEDALCLGRGAIKVNALIETLPAAFQIDEIIHALRDRIVGLGLGNRDYLFSRARALRAHDDPLLPDAGQLLLAQPPLRALTRLLVDTCHRRGIHAIGAGARDVADRHDPEARHQALARVRQVALREARAGHDGTTVTHAGLVPLARRVFDHDRRSPDAVPHAGVDGHDLLASSIGTCTAAGLRADVVVGLRYLDAWLRGQGRLLLAHRVVDAASAELARVRMWQRVHHHGRLDDGTEVTPALVQRLFDEELASARKERATSGSGGDRLDDARGLLLGAVLGEQLSASFTTAAYEQL
jgi:malate synthase